MIKNLLILLCLGSLRTFGQDYAVNWLNVVPKEPGIVNYQIQTSINNTVFITVPNGTILPRKRNDTNRYVFTIATADYWVRIKTLFTTTVTYTEAKKVTNTNVVITNAVLKINSSSDNLSFTANNEGEVSYYSIEKSINGSSTWGIVGKLYQAAKKNYTVNITKIGSNRRYRVRAVYKNGIFSPYVNFN